MADIAQKARFDLIRYAQAWEDSDVLCEALGPRPGGSLLSICAAGDNALALLTLDPARVVAVDLSSAQLACLRLRMAAMRRLDHAGFLELLGARPSSRRDSLFDEIVATLDPGDQIFWRRLRPDVLQWGVGSVGKFENYFRIFRRWILPLVHSRAVIDGVFAPRAPQARAEYFDAHWNNWRWRLMLSLFFSNRIMGRLGRDPAFFDHVEGSLAEHVAGRVRHAGVDLDPSANPYMRTILTGLPGDALPRAWRAEHYETIRSRLDRLELVHGDIATAVGHARFDGFNLSDIFEYMDPASFETVYGLLLDCANSGARLVYWNMMAPRALPARFAKRARPLTELAARLGAQDKAFFYSAFHIDEAL
jgi:S-adenosylmethionine-diacylglycerol 3-amino-3-carboxypropyl transferase